jgi:hypothetical protein
MSPNVLYCVTYQNTITSRGRGLPVVPVVVLVGTNASGNVEDGVHVDGADDVVMRETVARGNARWAVFFDVTVSYDQTAVDAAGVNESTIRLWTLGDEGPWTPVPGSVASTDADTGSANLSDFSVLAPPGDAESDRSRHRHRLRRPRRPQHRR